MAADEYYDAIGDVLSYVLSAEDLIHGQQRVRSRGKRFFIERDGTVLELNTTPDKRYFTITYEFSLSQKIVSAYEDESELLQGHLEQYDIDDSTLRDENLHEKVALRRVRDVDSDEANKLLTGLNSVVVHSDCRVTNRRRKETLGEPEDEIWDGITISGLLYPYESTFSPRHYEQVAQEVISAGKSVDNEMAKLDVMQQVGFEAN